MPTLNEPLFVSGSRGFGLSNSSVWQLSPFKIVVEKICLIYEAYTSQRNALVRNWTALDRDESLWRLGATFKWGCNFRVSEFPTRVFKFNSHQERESVALFSTNVLFSPLFFGGNRTRSYYIYIVGTRIVQQMDRELLDTLCSASL